MGLCCKGPVSVLSMQIWVAAVRVCSAGRHAHSWANEGPPFPAALTADPPKALSWAVPVGQGRNRKMLAQKTVLVTGANRGLGLEVSRLVLKNGGRVVMAVRDVKAGGFRKL